MAGGNSHDEHTAAIIRRVWPWSALWRLRRDLAGTRTACSAADKRANRLAEYIRKIEARCARLRAQIASDQAYIDALEARLGQTSVQEARGER